MIYRAMTQDEMTFDLLKDEYANWSVWGAQALVAYLDELSEELEEDMQFDRVALRCEFTEYSSIEEAMEAYGIDRHPNDLRHNTTVINCENGHVIVQDF